MRVAREDEMTKQLSRLLWPALAVATIAMSSVSAEAGDIRCRVPFDFTVKGRTLAAGNYEISEVRGVLTLRGQKDGAIVLTRRVGSSTDHRLRVVFEKYGEAYVLRQAWMGSGGSEVAPSRQERELAQKARNGQTAAAERIEIPVL